MLGRGLNALLALHHITSCSEEWPDNKGLVKVMGSISSTFEIMISVARYKGHTAPSQNCFNRNLVIVYRNKKTKRLALVSTRNRHNAELPSLAT